MWLCMSTPSVPDVGGANCAEAGAACPRTTDPRGAVTPAPATPTMNCCLESTVLSRVIEVNLIDLTEALTVAVDSWRG